MIRHIVVWKFLDQADGRTRLENLELARKALLELPSRIPGILAWEVGLNAVEAPEAFDLALVSLFEDREALAIYQNHPEHQRVVAFLRNVRLHRAVVDCEVESTVGSGMAKV